VRSLAASREPGESGAFGEQVVEVMRGHELGARLAMHVDELGERELDATVSDDLPGIVGVLGERGHATGISAEAVCGQWLGAPVSGG
jgi:hypothetical protein